MGLPPTPVALRRAVPGDAEAMRGLAQAAYRPYVARMGRRPMPMDADYDAAAAGDGSAESWVAEVDGVVVGYLVLVEEDDGMLLENVAVDPARHGRGVGRALLELAEQRTRALRLDLIRLYTHVTMVENQRLYERIGYAETHRGGEDGLVRVFYEKHLP